MTSMTTTTSHVTSGVDTHGQTHHGAVKARSQATNQLKALLVTAPAELREQLRTLSNTKLIAT
jgi:hypothetical protein